MYKKVLYISILSFGLSSFAFADDVIDDNSTSNFNPGIYFGGQLGMSDMHYGSQYMVSGNAVDNIKFAWRACAGYAFSQFISAELGYDYYGRPNFKAADGNTQNILQYGADLFAKASLPLDYGFGLYVKGGLAWVHRSALHSNEGDFAEKRENSRITPVGALGLNYWFAPNIAVDLSWAKTMTISDLPTTDFFGLGIIYKINI